MRSYLLVKVNNPMLTPACPAILASRRFAARILRDPQTKISRRNLQLGSKRIRLLKMVSRQIKN